MSFRRAAPPPSLRPAPVRTTGGPARLGLAVGPFISAGDLGFALGAVIPNEVWPYQWLPLLPLVLLVAVRAVEQRRAGTLVVMAVLMLGFYRAPCDLPFPNLWTVAAVGLFVLGVWENRLFRSASNGRIEDGAQL